MNGYLYFTELSGYTIRRMDLTTYEIVTIAGSGVAGLTDGIGLAAQFENPYRMTTDGTYLYVTEDGLHGFGIRKINPITGEVTTFAGNRNIYADADGPLETSTMSWPPAIVWTPSGLFYSNDGLNIGWIH
jgi:hypothetical protein